MVIALLRQNDAKCGMVMGATWLPWRQHFRPEIVGPIEKTKGTENSRFSNLARNGFSACTPVVFGDGSEARIVSSNLADLTDGQQQDDRIRLLMPVAKAVCSHSRSEQDEASRKP